MLRIDTTGWNNFLFDVRWWKRSWSAVRVFSPRFIPCALGITIANLISIGGSTYVLNAIRSMQGATLNERDLQNLLILTVCAFVAMCLSMVLALWSLSSWLFNLTAFARAFVESNGEIQPAHVSEAVTETKSRQGFIARVWLMATLYLLPIVMPLTILIAIKTLFWSSTPVIDVSVAMPNLFTPGAYLSAIGLGLLLSVISFGYSFLVIAFSSISNTAAFKTANLAVSESFKQGPNVFIITTLILAANIVITSPQLLISFFPWSAALDTPLTECAAQIWMGITSVFIWPLSVAPYCQITRQENQ